MQVVILRGSDQIGGNLISISCENTTILLDAGEELEGDDGIPPQAKALTRPGGFDAVFVTHYHRDHLGLAYEASPDIPSIWVGRHGRYKRWRIVTWGGSCCTRRAFWRTGSLSESARSP